MNMFWIIHPAGLLLLLVFSAFFSSSETALFSLNSIQIHRLRQKHGAAGRRVADLLAHPATVLSTILIGNTFVNIASSALAYTFFEGIFPGRGELAAIPVMTIILLLFCEVTPKRIAMHHAERMALLYSPVLKMLVVLLYPFRVIIEQFAKVFSHQLAPRRPALTEDEFMTVVEVGEEEGLLDEEERSMVDGIIRLEEMQVSDIMTPRVDLTGVSVDAPREEFMRVAASVTFRFLPVFRGSLDHIEGFLDVPAFLLNNEGDPHRHVAPPFLVPETCPLDTLLSIMQRERHRVAVVIDEFGGTAGLVTRGDILEEIADDVENEFGEMRPDIEAVSENRWLIDGSTSLEDVNYELDLNLEAEGADRIAGWVNAHAERLPRVGEVISAQGVRVAVQRLRRHRITLVILEKLPGGAERGDDS